MSKASYNAAHLTRSRQQEIQPVEEAIGKKARISLRVLEWLEIGVF
jgi:hypothetical protein